MLNFYIYLGWCCVQHHPIKTKIYNLNLTLAVSIAQRLVGPRKELKQPIQIQHNIVKNPMAGGKPVVYLQA